jgi:hypothetical protein
VKTHHIVLLIHAVATETSFARKFSLEEEEAMDFLHLITDLK